MTHSPREVYLLMSSRYLSETVLHDWSLPIPSCSSPLFKAALSFEANEHPSGSGSCRRDFCWPSVFAFFASVQSFLGLRRGVQLPLCPRKCCQEGGCEEQPWGLAGSKVSFNCAEFQGQPKRMGRGGQVLGVPGHRGLPGGTAWAWAQEELMEMEEMFHWWERGHQGGRWGRLHFSALGTISGDPIYLHSRNALQHCAVLQVWQTGCRGALIPSGRDNALNTYISTDMVWNPLPIFLLSGWLC